MAIDIGAYLQSKLKKVRDTFAPINSVSPEKLFAPPQQPLNVITQQQLQAPRVQAAYQQMQPYTQQARRLNSPGTFYGNAALDELPNVFRNAPQMAPPDLTWKPFNFAEPVANKIQNPYGRIAANVGLGIGEGILNLPVTAAEDVLYNGPKQVLTGALATGANAGDLISGKQVRPQKAIGDAATVLAGLANVAFYTGLPGQAKEATKQVAKPSLKAALKAGHELGLNFAEYQGVIGYLEKLADDQQSPVTDQQAHAAIEGVMQAGMGYLAGSLLGNIGYGVGAGLRALKGAKPTLAKTNYTPADIGSQVGSGKLTTGSFKDKAALNAREGGQVSKAELEAMKAPKNTRYNYQIPEQLPGTVATVPLSQIEIRKSFAESPSASPDAPPVLRKLANGKYEVWDGMHNLAARLKRGQTDIQAVIVDPQSKTTIKDAMGGLQTNPQAGFLNLGAVLGGKKKEAPQPVLRPGESLTNGIRERGFTTSVKENPAFRNEVRAGVSGITGVRNTKDAFNAAKQLVATDLTGARDVALNASDDRAVFTSIALIQRYQKTGDVGAAIDIANQIAPKLTESGRFSQAASVVNSLSPEGIVTYATKELKRANKDASLTPEQATAFISMARRIKGMAEGTDRSRAIYELMSKINENVPSTILDKATTLWKAGLLTGVKTSGVNIASNVSHGTTEIAKDVPATVADSVLSLFTGKRTKSFTVKGEVSGTAEGFKRGAEYLQTGFDERNVLSKYDFKKVNFGKGKAGKAAQAYTDSVFRLLGTEDQPFYYGAQARSMYEQAKVSAINKGLKGEAKKAFIDTFVANPPAQATQNAAHDAAVAVFQNPTILGKLGSAVSRIPVVGQFIAPFTRTPGAVATQVFNYSPAGLPGEIVKQITQGRFNQKSLSEAFGRSTIGTIPLAVGAALYKGGQLALNAPPANSNERKLWDEQNKQPNSVLINGKWRNINVLGPAGFEIVVGGYFQRGLNETGSVYQAMSQAAAGMGRSITDQSFLQGVSGVLNAVNDPVRYGESWVTNLAGSVVPTLSSDIARSVDPFERQAKGITAGIKARIPVLRETLPPQTNEDTGQPIQRRTTLPGTLFDPTRPRENRSGEMVDYYTGKYQESILNSFQTKTNNIIKDQSLTDQQKEQKIQDEQSRMEGRLQQLQTEVSRPGKLNLGTSFNPPGLIAGASADTSAPLFQFYQDANGDGHTLDLRKLTSMPATTNYERALRDEEVYKVIDGVANSTLSSERKQQIYQQLGIDPQDAQYYGYAAQPEDARAGYIADMLQQTEPSNYLQILTPLRQVVHGKPILTTGIIDDLYNQGILDSGQKKYLKSITDYKAGVTKLKASGTGKKKKLKAAKKISLKKISVPKAKIITPKRPKGPSLKALTTPTKRQKLPAVQQLKSFESVKASLLKAR